MAILIPSKNIYEYAENKKGIENQIKQIVLGAKKPQIVKEKEVVVFEGDSTFVTAHPIEEKNVSSTALIGDYHVSADSEINYIANFAIAKKEWKKEEIAPLNFKKYQDKKLITNVYNKNDRSTDPKFDYSGYEVKGNLDVWVRAQYEDGTIIDKDVLEGIINSMERPTLIISSIEDNVKSQYALNYINPIFSNYSQQSNIYSNLLNIEKVFGNVETNSKTPYDEYSVSAVATLREEAKPISSIVYNPTTKQYTLNLKTLSYIRDTYASQGEGFANRTQLAEKLNSGGYISNTEYLQYALTSVKATLYGDTSSLELEDKSITIGANNEKPFAIDGSELMQDSVYVSYDNGSTKTEENLQTRFGNTLKHYENGKEIYVIMCDFNEYYDEQGKLVKSTKSEGNNMSFDIDDVVIPFVRGADGKDRYLSFKKDGQPKSFYVKGTEIIYDGACLQKLYLQEV